MRWQIATVIFQKEILETLRDRRTLAVMLLLPMVMYPVLIVVFGQLVTHQVAQIESQTGLIGVIGTLPEELKVRLEDDGGYEIVELETELSAPESIVLQPPNEDRRVNPLQLPETELPEIYEETAREILDGATVDAIILISGDFEEGLNAERMMPVMIFYDDTSATSRSIRLRLVDLLTRWRIQIQTDRVAAHPELPTGFANPLLIEANNTATAIKKGGFLASRIIPIILIMMVLMGAFYPAIDLTAGEKERGTLQTLLTAPAESTEIIAGKFMTVFVVAIISSAVNLFSMTLAISWMLKNSPAGNNMAFVVDWGNIAICLVQLVPIAALFAAMLLAISIFAQSFREAQNYLTPVYLLVIAWAALTMLPTLELDYLTAMVPGLNIMLLMRELLVDPPNLGLTCMVLVANFGYALAALGIAVRIFQNEQVLVGGAVAVGDVFGLNTGGVRRATPAVSLSAFLLNLVLLFYIGSAVQQANMFWGMLLSQWVLILLPSLLIPYWLKLDLRKTLSLHRPGLMSMLGAVFIGLTGWAIIGHSVSALQHMVLPMPADFAERMQEALGIQDGKLALWQMLFAFALSPAICEEMLFRGLIFGGFRGKLKKVTAIVLTGLLFGLFHLTIYRILPTAALGIVITWVVYRGRSIWPGVVLHFLNNATAIIVTKYEWLPGLADLTDGVNYTYFMVAGMLFIAGIWLTWGQEDSAEPEPLSPSEAKSG